MTPRWLLALVEDYVDVKPGVRGLDSVSPMLLLAALIYGLIRYHIGVGRGTITSATDGGDAIGRARSADSAHRYGMALDLRTTDLSRDRAAMVAKMLIELTQGVVTVVLEEDHIHVQLTGWRELARAQGIQPV